MINSQKNSKSCDICLVTLPGNWSSGQIPYYYLVLAAYLESRNFRTEILDFAPRAKEFGKRNLFERFYRGQDFQKELYFSRVVESLQALRPKFVGISIFTLDYFLGMELAAYIKKNYDCQIVMGNVHASLFPEDCIFPGSPVDFVVVGEGEETLVELLETSKKSSSLENVAGLCFLKEGNFFKTTNRQIMNIAELPLIPFEKIDMEYYLKPRQILIRDLVISGVDLFTGRGCPFFCDFCAANSIFQAQGVKKGVRYQLLDNVFANVDILVKKYKIDGFYILDDTFTISEERVIEFCRRIKPYGIVWGADTRVNFINPRMLKAMKESGCVQLDFGVESGSSEMLKKISKGISKEQIISAFKMCDEAGIRTLANILINLPGEKEQHIKETEDLLKKIRPSIINVSILKPYPATPVFEDNIKMDHIEYINALKKFLAGDLSVFKLCDHGMDLKEISKKLAGYARKDFGSFLHNFKITEALILKSARRNAYLYKILRICTVKLILTVKRLRRG